MRLACSLLALMLCLPVISGTVSPCPEVVRAASPSASAALPSLRWVGSRLCLRLPLTEERGVVGSRYAVVVTPSMCGATDTLRLEPFVFRGAKNRRITTRARHFRERPDALTPEHLLGDTIWVEREWDTAQPQWAWLREAGLTLRVDREAEGCCAVRPLEPWTQIVPHYVAPFRPVLAPVADNTGKAGELQRTHPVLCHISDYRPYDDTRILRREEGALYVHFPLDRTDLRHDFRGNAATLDQIVQLTDQIMADTTSSVKLIQIIGLASPEGSVRRNLALGAGRATALRTYIQRHARARLSDAMFECINGGEAWTELRDQLEERDFPGRDALLHIIRETPDPDLRERRMRALDGGRPYAFLKANVLADQRNSGYLRIYYDYVPDEAARTINRASELLHTSGHEAEALVLLRPLAHDPRSYNALGVALYLTGHKAEALDFFRRAAAMGNAQAAENLRQLGM